MKFRRFFTLLLITSFALSSVVNISLAYRMVRPSSPILNIRHREENAKVGDDAAVGIGLEIKDRRPRARTTDRARIHTSKQLRGSKDTHLLHGRTLLHHTTTIATQGLADVKR